MSLIRYESHNFKPATLATINQANEILEDYASRGFDLTLRQLYYQFVARALIPNTQRSYKNLGTAVSNGRLAGLIDWDYIIDRTRKIRSLNTWENAYGIMVSTHNSFRIDKWAEQPYHIEVWIEKDALIGVIQRICNELRINYFSCRGYTSLSAMWRAARRLRGHENDWKETVILHLGDHDPSGLDMTRDIQDRLKTFGSEVDVRRIALNMDQIDEYNPPPNPAKLSDSRAGEYVPKYGYDSWELDALEPEAMEDLIESAVLELRNGKLWDEATYIEDEHKEDLKLAVDNWDDVVQFLRSSA
ncbi:hypothetical protein LCGC14_0444350 [marine sediment metagenome]|uniref:DUF2399 domain-containing protein n=1 Tax=marine sediment metagenome TaxID=412755 RepID=A0A0F9V6H4_9ZZZZ